MRDDTAACWSLLHYDSLRESWWSLGRLVSMASPRSTQKSYLVAVSCRKKEEGSCFRVIKFSSAGSYIHTPHTHTHTHTHISGCIIWPLWWLFGAPDLLPYGVVQHSSSEGRNQKLRQMSGCLTVQWPLKVTARLHGPQWNRSATAVAEEEQACAGNVGAREIWGGVYIQHNGYPLRVHMCCSLSHEKLKLRE